MQDTPRPLNARQAKYLELLYQADQEAEIEQRRRWHQRLTRDPARQWRWIPFSTNHPRVGLTAIQQRLAQAGMHNPGSGATLSALARCGLIDARTTEVDTPHGPAQQRQIRLTRDGCGTARELQPRQAAGPGGLPVWLEDALLEVRKAPPPGLPKTRISRMSARRLGPTGYQYIEDATRGHTNSPLLGRITFATGVPNEHGQLYDEGKPTVGISKPPLLEAFQRWVSNL